MRILENPRLRTAAAVGGVGVAIAAAAWAAAEGMVPGGAAALLAGALVVVLGVAFDHTVGGIAGGANKEASDYKAALDEHAIVAITDSRGKITYVNDKFCSISQYSRDELIGQDHRVINSGFHPREFFEGLWRTIGSGSPWNGEIRNRAKDGSHYWVDTTIIPFLDDGGKPERYVAIRADITERKLAEEKLQAATRELERKNEELESIVYAASHDLRSPLVNVQGFTAVVEEQLAEAEAVLLSAGGSEAPGRAKVEGAVAEVGRSLSFIKAGVEKIDGLLDGLLTISRVGRAGVRLRHVDLGGVVKNALDAMFYQVEEAGAHVVIDGPLPTCIADEALLDQAFSNLFDNALKYRSPERALKIHVSAEVSGKTVTCRVCDNGIGIAPEHRAKVFDLFRRLNPGDTPGQGLGLAIVRRSLDRMGGGVSVAAAGGEGSCFTLVLPAAP